MDELISKLAVIQIIEKMRARIGHNLERSIGKSIIEILDEVGEDVGKLPSALGTNLAEVGTDLISRQDAIDDIWTVSPLARLDRKWVDRWLRQLPSAEPTFDARDTQYNLPIGKDLISRQQAIDAISCDITITGRRNAELVAETIATFVDRIKALPSAQSKMGKWIYHIDDLFPAESTMECNQCHAEQPLTCDDEFCPHCGAKMEVTE